MRKVTLAMASVSLLFSAAIFGFFYAWICSTMWGLDGADPRVSIQAMQAMNASVRNWVFAPAYFGTFVALWVTALLSFTGGNRHAAAAFGLAGALYFVLAFLVTSLANLPLNETLAAVQTPETAEAAHLIWNDYSQPWQFWNVVRTIGSGIAFLVALAGVFQLGRSGARVKAA